MTVPDHVDEFEKQLANVDTKTILIWQLAELSAIRTQLEGTNQPTEAEGESETYMCTACNSEIPESELQDHAETAHNAPPNSDPLSLGLYE